LENRIDIKLKDSDGQTALDFAKENKAEELIRLLSNEERKREEEEKRKAKEDVEEAERKRLEKESKRKRDEEERKHKEEEKRRLDAKRFEAELKRKEESESKRLEEERKRMERNEFYKWSTSISIELTEIFKKEEINNNETLNKYIKHFKHDGLVRLGIKAGHIVEIMEKIEQIQNQTKLIEKQKFEETIKEGNIPIESVTILENEILGKGISGITYKGLFLNGTKVAVKILNILDSKRIHK